MSWNVDFMVKQFNIEAVQKGRFMKRPYENIGFQTDIFRKNLLFGQPPTKYFNKMSMALFSFTNYLIKNIFHFHICENLSSSVFYLWFNLFVRYSG